MSLLLLLYLAIGYWIFWAGLSDDLAHIPSIAITRSVIAITIGPAMLAGLWIFGGVAAYCYYRDLP